MAGNVTLLTARALTVGESDLATAGPLIERWHYSHRVPTGENIFYVWWIDAGGRLPSDLFGQSIYAAACYGIGVNPFQAAFLEREYGYRVYTPTALVELKRLARVEPKLDGLPLTRFLAQCHRLLKRRGYRLVVSFSDPAHGHNGGIYRAANFKHCGQTAEEWHVADESGDVRHRRYAYRYARRNGVSIAEARSELNLTRVLTPAKDRWVLQL